MRSVDAIVVRVVQRRPDEPLGRVEEGACQADNLEVVVLSRRDAVVVELVDPRPGTREEDR
jgi:hypothetical protein